MPNKDISLVEDLGINQQLPVSVPPDKMVNDAAPNLAEKDAKPEKKIIDANTGAFAENKKPEGVVETKDGEVVVTLKKSHTHQGVEYPAKTQISVDKVSADYLIEHKLAD